MPKGNQATGSLGPPQKCAVGPPKSRQRDLHEKENNQKGMIAGEPLDHGAKGAYPADVLGVFPKCGEELILVYTDLTERVGI
ncbi:MAG: hypothetical protein NPIRA03_24550 [Nitrospirales bacterium]|nr:MAG: hypothetical protein NPIRA03_24550 [Nitrospirales bacterium]